MTGRSTEPGRGALRGFVFGLLWLAVSVAVLAAPGCYGRNCEGGIEVFGPDAGQGTMVSDDAWESGPVDGTYLWFPRQRIYIFDVPALGGRTPFDYSTFLSGSPTPTKTNGDFVPAAGNNVLMSGQGPNRINVKNDTCSDYYLRLVLYVRPLPPTRDDEADAGANGTASDGGPTDGGPTDGGPTDAGTP